ncbi:MAG: ATP-binding cassette domain-containing protein [Desulfobacterales bacterium]|nr:ATP-binding cassette domain-containing protein [Desulfobacterales bacterium]
MNNEKQEPIISFKNVYLSFGEKDVLKDLSLSVYPKEIVSIAGPSGSGKSTILKLISGLIEPDSGEIIVKATKIGMAFQYAALFNSLSIWENLALALQETTNLSKEEIDIRVKEALKIVKLEHTEEMYPAELSGGMQKRISIARALALHPEILLYDEPSTGLDPATASKLEDDMVRLRDEIGVTSIVVTHDIDTIVHISERILILDKGHLVWQGSNDDFKIDQSPYPCSFRERRTLESCKKQYNINE